MRFLMASINSSGLPPPAHACSLQPILGSKSLSPLPTHPLQSSSRSQGPSGTYAPSGFRLDTRGSGRVLGWPRSCLVLTWGGKSVPAVGEKPTGWGKTSSSGRARPPRLAGHNRCSATGQSCHPLWVLQRRNYQVPFRKNPPAASSHACEAADKALGTTLPSPNTERSFVARGCPHQPTAPGD